MINNSRLLPQNMAPFGSDQLSKFYQFARKSMLPLWVLSSRTEGTYTAKRLRITDWNLEMAVGMARDDALLLFSPRPTKCGRPLPWVAHWQLGNCLPPFRYLLTLVHWCMLINGRWLLGSQMTAIEKRERERVERQRGKRKKREREVEGTLGWLGKADC